MKDLKENLREFIFWYHWSREVFTKKKTPTGIIKQKNKVNMTTLKFF